MEELQQRIMEVQSRIELAAQRSGRSSQDITLLAVSKTVDNTTVDQAYDLGIRDFGENRVQEFASKIHSVPQARWHFIGRLQSNKVKDVVGHAFLIHSVDRWSLAQELDKRGQYLEVSVPVLLQVNISGEESKTGLHAGEVESFLQSVGELKSLRVMGFMTIAALNSEPEESRPIFRELAALKNKVHSKNFTNVELNYLSMGMSQDYEIAIEEGANIVRIGSALFI
ncbi:MAG: YggS family pyridoxal phosphate-dependent enzyme [Firmicutes bacterium HGW-Firmicutes-15]|nr:MAG: YggS family pyridoxal phosphate-dependent enzyme [Firmicutes bacterium HGW-Firmicutes-15]